MELAGQSSFSATNQTRFGAPFLRLEAVRWTVTGWLDQQQQSCCCTGFCLCVGRSRQFREGQLEHSHLQPVEGAVIETPVLDKVRVW